MLHKHFIPRPSNNHRPHLLSKQGLRHLLIIIVMCEAIAIAGVGLMKIDGRFGTASVIPVVLSDLTNKERSQENLQPLRVSERLNQAATLKAEDMARHQYFAHTSPQGKSPWYWLKQVGYEYQYAGENLAVDFSDSKDVARAWMNSPGHKSNIIKKNYTEVGTGIAEGRFEGKKTIFVAQVYANPLVSTPPSTLARVDEAPLQNEREEIHNNDTERVLGSATEPEPDESQKNDKEHNEAPSSFAPSTDDTKNEQAQAIPAPGHRGSGPITMADTRVPQVLGAQTSPESSPSYSNFFERIIASPTSVVNHLLLGIMAVVVIVLVIYLLLRRKNLHRDIVTNALIIIAVAAAVFIVNYCLSRQTTTTTQSFDYENPDLVQEKTTP